MADFIDFKRIKEEIIETDSIIKKNTQLKKHIQLKNKQLKQLTNDFEILKLEYDYKLFQLDEKKKQCENFKTDNVNLESENSIIKEDYNKSLNDYQVLHIKYQTMCKNLEESQESLEKHKNIDIPVKTKNCVKKRKREILEACEDSCSNSSAESDEDGKLLEKQLTVMPDYAEENFDMHLQKQTDMGEVENISDLKMKITHLTSSNNILTEEVTNCKEQIKTLNIILQSKEIEWSEKEKKLAIEVAELKKCPECHKNRSNLKININQSIFDIGEGKVEIHKSNLKESSSDLSNQKWKLHKPPDSFVNLETSEVASNLKTLSRSNLEDIATTEIECDLPSFAEKENLSDEESDISNINDVFKEMRIHYRLVSPIRELHKDSVCFKNSTNTMTSELSKLKSTPENISIAAGCESVIHNNSRNDKYNKQRQQKAKMLQRLINRKKAQDLYWRRKMKFIQKSETFNSKVKINKINTSENDLDHPKKKNEEIDCSNNASVDSIITVLADLVSQKLRYPRTRKKSIRLNQSDESKNVLEVNRMLLRRARQLMNNPNVCEKHENSTSLERSSSELDIPIFDSCYESLNSNPPSIENVINDNKIKIDWQHQNKTSSERGNTGVSQSDNRTINVQESNKNGTNERVKSVIIPEFGKQTYSMSPQNSENFQMNQELGKINELFSSNVEIEMSKTNKILKENSVFESNINYPKDHCSNIQNDEINEIQQSGGHKKIVEKMNRNVKSKEHTEPLEHVHQKINNLEIDDNFVLSIEHSQIQSRKYNLNSNNSRLKIYNNTNSAENESEISNSNQILEENLTFESNVNCLKECSSNILSDASNITQKSRSYFGEVAKIINAEMMPKEHIEPLGHLHQEINSLEIDDNSILNIEQDLQSQSGKYNLNLSNSELEIDKNKKSVDLDNEESEINDTNKVLEENSTIESNVNCLEVCSFNIENNRLDDSQEFSSHFEGIEEKINEDVQLKEQTETPDYVHPIINNLGISNNLILGIEENSQILYEKHYFSLSSSELEDKSGRPTENHNKLTEMGNNKHNMFVDNLNFNEENHGESKLILEKNNEEFSQNESINNWYNKMYDYGYEEEECGKIGNNVQGGCNRNIEIDNQNQCKDKGVGELEPLCKLNDIHKNNKNLESEPSKETLITNCHSTKVMDLNVSQTENKICENNLKNVHNTFQTIGIDIKKLKSQKESDKFKIEYSKKRGCSHSEKILKKSEEFHDDLKSAHNHSNLVHVDISDSFVHDHQIQMETGAELVGTTISTMTEFQSKDINHCYKLFHYDDNTSSELFENYSDSKSVGEVENNSSKEPTNRSNESMWYDFSHNSLVDIRKSKSYQGSDVSYRQNLYTNDFETNKRSNEDEFVKVGKILKLENISSSCDSVHALPMGDKTKSIQSKMKLYTSKSKNTVKSTYNIIDCKTQMSTNEPMNKDYVKASDQKVENDNNADVVKSCKANSITHMKIDFNISQHLLENIEENCLDEYPSICIPSMINNLNENQEDIHTNYSKEDESISVDHLVKNKQKELPKHITKYLKNVNSSSNKLIKSEDCINSIELSETTFSNNLNSNCPKLENVQLEQSLNDTKAPLKRKLSTKSRNTSKTVVSNYNLRKSSKLKKEENVFVPSADDTPNNISLKTSNVKNTCVEVEKTSGIDLKDKKMENLLSFNNEIDLFGSLSESSDNELINCKNPNKMSNNLEECSTLQKEIIPDPLPPENYSNNVNCQNDENTSNMNCSESENLPEFSKDIDQFGSLSESPDDECSVSSNYTNMLKTVAPTNKLQKSLKEVEEINPTPVAVGMRKNVSFNSSDETGLQDFSGEIDLFGNLSETSHDDFFPIETNRNCKPTTVKKRRKSNNCNARQKKKVVAKKGLLMKKSIRTYKDKNLAWNSHEKSIILHNESIIKTNAISSNMEEKLENNKSNDILLNQYNTYFPGRGNISKNLSYYKNTETSSDSPNKEGRNSQSDSMKLQSSVFKRSRTNSGTYSINPVTTICSLKNITKKIKEESQTSSSISSNGIHDVKVKQNIEILTSSDNFQKKNVILNLRNTSTTSHEDSERNYDTSSKTTATTHEESEKNHGIFLKKTNTAHEDSEQNYDISSIKIRKSLVNLANENDNKNFKKKSRFFNYLNNDSKSGNKDKNPSEIPPTSNKASVTNSYPKEEKINILQEVVIRPSNTNPKKLEIHAPIQMRISGFKRPNNSKIIPPCPLSPTPSIAEEIDLPFEPIVIPLEKPAKMEPSKAAALFRKLITYSKEEKTVEEISRQFTSQDVDHISRLILEQITQDTEKANKDDTLAPLMTDTQRVMLGFMLKLEQMNVENLITTYLKISEARLLQVSTLQEIDTITRLYVAICKSHKYIGRIRRMCCDAFYFMGDFAIPFFFIILVSWIQVLPVEEEMENFPMVKVLIQLVNLKSCNFPGYNLLPLRDLLHKYYKYPSEPWNSDSFFKELFNNYLKNPVRPNDFSILLYCKNNSSKWVNEKINNLIRPTLEIIKKENLKATVIILVSNIISQFNGKVDGEYIDSARQWLKCMIEGEEVTEVIKESIILSLRKLPKTQKKHVTML